MGILQSEETLGNLGGSWAVCGKVSQSGRKLGSLGESWAVWAHIGNTDYF